MLARDERSSLFGLIISDEEKKFDKIVTCSDAPGSSSTRCSTFQVFRDEGLSATASRQNLELDRVVPEVQPKVL
jgi:hypothetical protein